MPQPRSTLFPYTTLFRSSDEHVRQQTGGNTGVQKRAKAEPPKGDRKSTRLNSSHRCISYAVFCLKKKKSTGCQTARPSPTLPLGRTPTLSRRVGSLESAR